MDTHTHLCTHTQSQSQTQTVKHANALSQSQAQAHTQTQGSCIGVWDLPGAPISRSFALPCHPQRQGQNCHFFFWWSNV